MFGLSYVTRDFAPKDTPCENISTTMDFLKQSESNEEDLNEPRDGRRGRKSRKPDKQQTGDVKAKLERSRQSARECRARKKLRYQYLEELVTQREKAVVALRDELEMYRQWSHELDEGVASEALQQALSSVKIDPSFLHNLISVKAEGES